MKGLERILTAVMGAAARRPLAVGLAVGLLAAAGAALALLRLEPSAATEQFVGRGTESAQATERHRQAFGEDAVFLLVKGDLTKLVLTDDLQRLLRLEGCIAGNKPDTVKDETLPGGANGPCAQFARTKPAKVVFGPGTFLNQSVEQITTQFTARTQQAQQQAQAAGQAAYDQARKQGRSTAEARRIQQQASEAVQGQFFQQLLQLGVRYGITGVPRLNDPQFVSQLVFDATKPAGTPKARFAYLFPNRDSAMVQVRMKPGLTEAQRTHAIEQVRAAARLPDFQPRNGGRYVVTGAPVVVADLTGSISSSILVLLLVAVGVMALTLSLVFKARLRLLPLGVALAATALTFGGLSLVGASLTMASIGVLPVLIGLAVDYAIQLQSRIQERRVGSVRRAVDQTARDGAPTVAVAAAATGAGFLVMLLSPVPMVRGFGLLLVAGIALAFVCALSLGVAVLAGALEGWGTRRRRRVPRPLRDAGAIARDAARDAGQIVRGSRPGRAVARGLTRHGELEAAPAMGPDATRTLPRRSLAAVLDALPLAAVAWALAGPAGWSVFATVVAVLAAAALLHGVLAGGWGWTPGKLLLGLRLVDRRGRPPGIAAALVRGLTAPADAVAGLRAAHRSPWRQRLGDQVAGTLVVRRTRLAPATGAAGAPPRPWALLTGGGLTALAPTSRPRLVLGVAAAVAVLGWGLDTQQRVESDILKLVPQDLPALGDLVDLQDSTGVGGEVDVVVRSDRLTEPETVRWMVSYQDRLLKRFGYSAERGCGRAEVCPAFSLPDLFRDESASSSKEAIEELLDLVPAYFSQGVITQDRRTATLAFGIKLMPLERQKEVIDAMRDGLDDPPDGVTAEVAGLNVLAADANDAIASPWWRALSLVVGLLAVLAVLLAAFRDRRRALVPLVPIALATGWSGLVLFALRVELNPMSVTMGALVIAISTEFSVLLSERYRRERLDGRPAREALERTYRSTGAAVLASGATAVAGFAVLVASDITMLRDFGAVTVVNLAVSLLGVLVVLPSVLLLAEAREGHAPAGPRMRLPRPSLGRPRLRRRRPAAEAA
ncbi:MMPL family transporter [Conexibacter sp. SYSU D00693]|uniref:MMPL family transporter n=1 Tax=Conexibacter sp. SYSU D00693 TaxID=2812560 RepID=UPI00196B8BB5|nr:MMPL family transporter [Conexibacter sp. SYSU D00693]